MDSDTLNKVAQYMAFRSRKCTEVHGDNAKEVFEDALQGEEVLRKHYLPTSSAGPDSLTTNSGVAGSHWQENLAEGGHCLECGKHVDIDHCISCKVRKPQPYTPSDCMRCGKEAKGCTCEDIHYHEVCDNCGKPLQTCICESVHYELCNYCKRPANRCECEWTNFVGAKRPTQKKEVILDKIQEAESIDDLVKCARECLDDLSALHKYITKYQCSAMSEQITASLFEACHRINEKLAVKESK